MDEEKPKIVKPVKVGNPQDPAVQKQSNPRKAAPGSGVPKARSSSETPASSNRPNNIKTVQQQQQQQDEAFRRYQIGYNVPNAVYKRLIREMVDHMASQHLIMERAALVPLVVAAEAFLVKTFQKASIVTRARQRKTLSVVDVETVVQIIDDPYLRRRSLPSIIFEGLPGLGVTADGN